MPVSTHPTQHHIHTLKHLKEMSKPAPGTYKIINRVLSVNNKQLAITANAEGNAATVTEESSSNTAQQVRISSLQVVAAPF